MSFPQLINSSSHTIWRYSRFYTPSVSPKYQLTLNEAWTDVKPVPDLAQQLSIPSLTLKLEQDNPTNSHKARTMAYQISLALQQEKKAVAISSTGNAAIAAASYCALTNISLTVFISPKTSSKKIAALRQLNCDLQIVENPPHALRQFCYNTGAENLNATQTASSLEGYQSIGFELYEQKALGDDLFIFVSSGSTYLGIGKALQTLLDQGELQQLPRLHCVHIATSSIPGVFKSMVQVEQSYQLSYQEQRRKLLGELLEKSGGSVITIADDELIAARKTLQQHTLDTSPEGCANFAAVIALSKEKTLGNIVCLLTGKPSQWEKD